MSLMLTILSLLLQLGLPVPQAPVPKIFHKLTTKEGLASNYVHSIWQDRNGFLWIGSTNGLQQFDGRYMIPYISDKEGKLESKPVYQIIEDGKGRMILRSGYDYGIFNPEDLSFHKIPINEEINRRWGESLWMDSKGEIYLLVLRVGILWYDEQNHQFTYKNSPIQLPEDSKPVSLNEDPKTGFYWIGLTDKLIVLNSANGEIYSKENNPIKHPLLDREDLIQVNDVQIDADRNFWVAYWNPDQYFVGYSEKENRFLDAANSLVNHTREYFEVNRSLLTRNGEIWKYGLRNLYYFNKEKQKFENQRPHNIDFRSANQLMEDKSGNIWIATDEGLFYHNPLSATVRQIKFESNTANPLYFQAVSEIKINEDSIQYWIGSWGKGVKILGSDLKEINAESYGQERPGLYEKDQIWCILQDRNTQLVWAGLQMGWLQISDLQKRSSKFFRFPSLQGWTIRDIVQDSKGNIFISSQSGHVYRFNAGSELQSESFTEIAAFGGIVPDLHIDKNDFIWAATNNNGVFKLDPESGEILKHIDISEIGTNNITKIVQLSQHDFAFASEYLILYNEPENKLTSLSFLNGLTSNGILSMVLDDEGFLWIKTPNGICKYNYQTGTFTTYGDNDGFEGLKMDGSASIFTSRKEILFVASNEIVHFIPSEFNESQKPQKPIFSSIKLFDQYLFPDSLTLREKQVYNYDENYFTFIFSIPEILKRDKLVFEYRLSSIDPGWIQAGLTNMGIYTLVPPGNYVFQVRTKNEAGEYSEISSFAFKIRKPYWETWWFRSIFILLLLAILAVFYRMHINRIISLANLRNRVARDLHDDMGSTLSTINILSTMAKSKLNTDQLRTSEYLSKISENSIRMMEAMDDIVWSIKPNNDSMDKIIARMREFTTNVLEAKEIDFRFEVEDAVYDLKPSMEVRRDLFLIFKEAVNNLAKYSKCSRAYIKFGILDKKLRLMIKDYGVGFDPQEADSGNGLNNMRKRADSLQADFSLISSPGKGAEVLIFIPIDKI
jgi:ligand-binding sensor domain-containing protein/two-component sensor histidine kinase